MENDLRGYSAEYGTNMSFTTNESQAIKQEWRFKEK